MAPTSSAGLPAITLPTLGALGGKSAGPTPMPTPGQQALVPAGGGAGPIFPLDAPGAGPSDDGGAEYDDGGADEEFGALQAVLQKAINSKKSNAKAKQRALLEELQATMAEQVKALDAQIAKVRGRGPERQRERGSEGCWGLGQRLGSGGR